MWSEGADGDEAGGGGDEVREERGFGFEVEEADLAGCLEVDALEEIEEDDEDWNGEGEGWCGEGR